MRKIIVGKIISSEDSNFFFMTWPGVNGRLDIFMINLKAATGGCTSQL